MPGLLPRTTACKRTGVRKLGRSAAQCPITGGYSRSTRDGVLPLMLKTRWRRPDSQTHGQTEVSQVATRVYCSTLAARGRSPRLTDRPDGWHVQLDSAGLVVRPC